MTTNRFTKQNLLTGLATFTKSDKKIASATSLFQDLVDRGTPHRNAIEITLKQALKGFANQRIKLKVARDAAGLTMRKRAQAIAKPATSRLKRPVWKPRASTSGKPVPHWSFNRFIMAVFVLLGVLLGAWFTVFVFVPAWHGMYGERFGDWLVLAILVIAVTTLLLGGKLGQLIVTIIRQRRGYIKKEQFSDTADLEEMGFHPVPTPKTT
jgi:hypothetical protein